MDQSTAQAQAGTTTTEDVNLVPLKRPYTTPAGQRIESLTVRELTVKDLRECSSAAGNDQVAFEISCIGRMVGLLPEDLDGMKARDYATFKTRFLDEVSGAS
jgi:hypothetical protein